MHCSRQGFEVSVKEMDNLLILLAEKRRKMEQEEAERNMQTLTEFLQCLRRNKVAELKEMQADLQYIKGDINSVERHRIELYMARDRFKVPRTVADSPATTKSWSMSIDRNTGATSSSRTAQTGMRMGNFQYTKTDGKVQGSSLSQERKDTHVGLESQLTNQTNLSSTKKKRVHAQFNNLQDCYLQKRRELANHSSRQEDADASIVSREGYNAGLADFQSVLKTFTQYSRMKVIAELRHGDLFYHTANIISSIEFNLDDELFATAGVSKCIKVFNYSSAVNEPVDEPFPVEEMSTRSKLSCLSWNKFSNNLIASSDYDGIVTVWDVSRRQSVVDYEEHEKRVWSVDFSRTEPSMLVSGSDDCKVKIWCMNQETSVLNIDMQANICCVKYNPASSFHVAVGSADHLIHYYDLRKSKQPLHIFSGHNKTVSYVKFLSNEELASASTDNTLRLWDVKSNTPIRTYGGHTNEKNFVGLSVNNGFLACGSETNEVFVYHKAISKPVTWHKFGSTDMEGSDEETGSYFISAVCWKNDSSALLAANSQGTIKVLVLAP
ncbi:E3 ubiquitin-protein ligase COP1-like isoform X2 [Impatiens glandulifera]|uniref:E3 ubiquitin-protein ligase COP1-like isoform X2 n=1 Tax=Impatiens glandulifera TaxID=253017 RepID=UPI001FB0DB22|nr:E3 ubiquitin-protein ligase COP1-like isoform X2 [Impatiens glandulifera]XP_047342062.1 E3 ubiquitin-protein ligase COP1-like isoform X2 [Impatiens glandulifera]